jgi:predicted Zn-dependent peptidase
MNISDRIIQDQHDGIALRLLPSPVESVVTIVGSFDTKPKLADGDDLVQEVAVEMLDKGTAERDRFAIARAIEDRGAEINFASHTLGVHFSIRCLKKDVDSMIRLMAEQLRSPAFEEDEFQKVRHQLASKIRRSLESTTVRSRVALTHELYQAGHPNYDSSPEDDLKSLASIELDDVKKYHQEQFSGDRLVLCAVGDLDGKVLTSSTLDSFQDFVRGDSLPGSTTDDIFDRLIKSPAPNRIDISMPDRNNLDVRMGATVDVRRDHPDFVALHVGNYVLGGNFSARLMSHVREELGLTYGIRSSLAGFDRMHSGFWQIGVTLSSENLEAGIEATKATIEPFVADGITADELSAKQRTLTGLYKVGLSTTRGLAQTMHAHFRNGFEASYIDEYPELVRALTVEDVNRAVSEHFDATKLVTTAAGSFAEVEPQI